MNDNLLEEEEKDPNLLPEGFRGSYAPRELYQLLAEGKINGREFALLMVVDALVRSKKNVCCASNEYLGRILGVSALHISRQVSDLIGKGYITQGGFTGRRRLIYTFWSNPKVPDGGSDEHMQICIPTVCRNADADEDVHKCISINRTESPLKGGTVCGKPSSNGKSKTIRDRYVRLASKLSDYVKSVKKVNHTPQQLRSWAVCFEKLHTKKGIEFQRIKRVLDWYGSQIDRAAKCEPYFPVAYSGDSFCDKFIGTIEPKMDRENAEAKKQELEDNPPPQTDIVSSVEDAWTEEDERSLQ